MHLLLFGIRQEGDEVRHHLVVPLHTEHTPGGREEFYAPVFGVEGVGPHIQLFGFAKVFAFLVHIGHITDGHREVGIQVQGLAVALHGFV